MVETMLVSSSTVGRAYCCKFCWSEWGHSPNRSAKLKLKRRLRRKENQKFKREVRGYLTQGE